MNDKGKTTCILHFVCQKHTFWFVFLKLQKYSLFTASSLKTVKLYPKKVYSKLKTKIKQKTKKKKQKTFKLHTRDFGFEYLCFALEKFFECKKSVQN